MGEAASLLLRGWSVPVGGSTPDRLKGWGSPLLCSCGGGSFRSGVQPPTGSRVGGVRFSALAGVDRSGRGFNPRPAQGLGESASLLLRGWIVPVGGSTPDRLKGWGSPLLCSCGGGSFRSGVQSPTGSRVGGVRFSALAGVDRSGRGFNPRPAQGLGESASLLLRGWIVPVGGSIPDRLKGWGRPLLCSCGGGSFRSGVQSPTGSRVGGGRFSALAGVDRSGRGCNPRPAREFAALGDDRRLRRGLRLRSRASRQRIPKQSLGTTLLDCQAALGETHSQAALGNDNKIGPFLAGKGPLAGILPSSRIGGFRSPTMERRGGSRWRYYSAFWGGFDRFRRIFFAILWGGARRFRG